MSTDRSPRRGQHALVTPALAGSTRLERLEDDIRDALRALDVAGTHGHELGWREHRLGRYNDLDRVQTALVERQVGHDK